MLRLRLAACVLAAIAALVVLAVGSAAPADPWIVFSKSPNLATGAPQLFRVRASGAGPGRITSGRRVATDPAFARDGRQIAFTRLSAGLFLVNVDGAHLRRLTANVMSFGFTAWLNQARSQSWALPFGPELDIKRKPPRQFLVAQFRARRR